MAAVPAQVAGVERIAVVTPRACRGDARGRARARHRRGLRGRRRAGDRRARLRDGDDRAGRQDRRPGQPLGDGGEAARLEPRRDRPARRAERGVVIADELGRPALVRRRPARAGRARPGQRGDPREPSAGSPTRCARSSPGPSKSDPRSWRRSTRRSRARTTTRRSTSSSGRRPEAAAAQVRNAGTIFLGTSAVLGDYAAGANHVLPTGGLARGAGGLGLEAFLKPVQIVRATRDGCSRRARSAPPLARARGPAAARRRAGGAVSAQPLPDGLSRRTSGRHVGGGGRAPRAPAGAGDPLRREHAAAPGRAAGPARRELRAAQRVPGRHVPRAARGRRATAASTPEQIVVGAGADDLIASARAPTSGPVARPRSSAPTYPLYRIASAARGRRASSRARPTARDLIWVCNPNNPTGEVRAPPRSPRSPRAHPGALSSSTRPTSSTAARPACR